MRSTDTTETVDLEAVLRGLDTEWCDQRSDAELLDYEAEACRVRSRIDAAVANVRAARARRHQRGCGHDTAADDESAQHTRRTRRESAADRRRGDRMSLLPRWSLAWAAGEVTTDHVDVIVAVPDRLRDALIDDEQFLLELARSSPADRFRTSVKRWQTRRERREGDDPAQATRRQRRLRMGRSQHHNDMYNVFGELDAATYAVVHTAISAEQRRLARADDDPGHPEHVPDRTHDQRMADALANICAAHSAGGGRSGPSRPLFLLLVDLRTLRGGLHPDGRCEIPGIGPIDPAEARRLLEHHDADFKTLVLDGRGAPLYLGTDFRFASDEQRQALAAMYPTCVGEHCDVPIDRCHIHHLDPATIGGPTDIDRMVPLCVADHHKVHDAGYRIVRDPDTLRVTWHPPPSSDGCPRRRSAGGVSWEEPALL